MAVQRVRLVFDQTEVGMVVVERHDAGPPRGLAKTLPTDVLSDDDQPVAGTLWTLSLLICAVRIQERRLCNVLRVGGIGQHRDRVAVDVGDVPAVEPLERAVRSRPMC